LTLLLLLVLLLAFDLARVERTLLSVAFDVDPVLDVNPELIDDTCTTVEERRFSAALNRP
jgi:hypothetical protein